MKAEFMKRRSRLPGKKTRAVLAVLLLLITSTVLAAWVVVTYRAGMDKQPTPESSAPSAGPLWTAADRRTVLLLFTDEGNERFVLAQGDPEHGRLLLCVLPGDARADGDTLTQTVRSKGAPAAAAAAQRITGIAVAHYVAMDGTALEKWLNHLEGGLTVTLPEDVIPSGGGVRLTAGECTLTAAQAVDVLRFTGWKDPALHERITADLLAAMARQYLIAGRSLSSDFAALTNIARTDLRIGDLTARREALAALTEREGGVTVEVTEKDALLVPQTEERSVS